MTDDFTEFFSCTYGNQHLLSHSSNTRHANIWLFQSIFNIFFYAIVATENQEINLIVVLLSKKSYTSVS